MPTLALEGVGATITFGTSTFTSDLLKLTIPERMREVLETTHLGTAVAKTYKPAQLQTVGVISAEFDHDPAASDLLLGDVETITIAYPLQSGQTTPAKIQFSGFVTKQGGEEFAVDAKMVTKVDIQVTGALTKIAAT